MRTGYIRDRLILASLILVIPFMLWIMLSKISQYFENHSHVIANQQEVGKDTADAYTSFMENVVYIERTIGLGMRREPQLTESDISAYLADVAGYTPGIMHMAFIDSKGMLVSSDMPQMVGRDASRFPSMRRIMEGTDWVVSDVFVPRIIGRPMFGISTGIRNDRGELAGIITALVDEEHLGKALHGGIVEGVTGNEVVIITDSKGVVALSTSSSPLSWEERQWSDLPFIRKALAGEPAVVERLKMPDGQVMMGSVQPIPGLGWTAAVFIPRESVIGPLRRQLLLHGLIVVLLIGLVVGMAIYLGNKLAEPVLDLAQTARTFGGGDLNARVDIRTGDELEFLGTCFNEMADELQTRTSQLNTALESQRHQSERLSALYNMAQGLVVTMTLDERLEVIARALVSICHAKRCGIFLRRGNRLIGTAGWHEDHPEPLQNLIIDLDEPMKAIPEVLLQGMPLTVHDVDTDPRIDQRYIRIFEDLSVKSFVALPLIRRKHLVGIAAFDIPGEKISCEPESLEVAQGIATLAAIAIENAQTFEKERNIAQALQGSLLPTVPERLGQFRFASAYYPALEMAELGGDFYDLTVLPDGRVALSIADVSGKGLEAAIFTAMGKYTLRAFISEFPSPSSALARANNALGMAGADWGFVTMFYGLLDTQTGLLTYASAGHPPCILVHADGRALMLPVSDRQPPLGVFQNIEYVEHEYQLSEGDVLVGYTDGAIEARRKDEQFEIGRLAEVAAESRHLSPKEIANSIYKAIIDFTRGKTQDDIALLVIKFKKHD